MTRDLLDFSGKRKYLTESERNAFVRAACIEGGDVGTFCLTLAFTGARISEVLALTWDRIDRANGAIIFETLRRRRRGFFRAVPVPLQLFVLLESVHRSESPSRHSEERVWRLGRTTAWKRVKTVMLAADIAPSLAVPRAARHAFGVSAAEKSIALNVVQRWMGHARIETTSIYTNVLDKEERLLARRAWRSAEQDLYLFGKHPITKRHR